MIARRSLALLLPVLALGCSGDDGRGRGTERVVPGGGGSGPDGVPPPVVHAPPDGLAVELVGPEVDGPVDVRDLSIDAGGGLWLVGDGSLRVRPPGSVWVVPVEGARSASGGEPVAVAGLDAGVAVVGYRDGPSHLVRLDGAGGATLRRLPLDGPVGRLVATDGPRGRAALAGTAAGIARVDGTGDVEGPFALPPPSSAIWAVTPAGAHLWLGDAHRLARLPGAATGSLDVALAPTLDLRSDADDSVVDVAACPSGELWASSLGSGVFRLGPEGGVRERLVAAEVLPQDHVLSVACDLDGSVWFGTSWGGLARLLPDGRFRYHAVTAGLPGDSIRRLLVVPDGSGGRTLWIATEGGAASYTGP